MERDTRSKKANVDTRRKSGLSMRSEPVTPAMPKYEYQKDDSRAHSVGIAKPSKIATQHSGNAAISFAFK